MKEIQKETKNTKTKNKLINKTTQTEAQHKTNNTTQRTK